MGIALQSLVQAGGAAHLGGGTVIALEMDDLQGRITEVLLKPGYRAVPLALEIRADPAGEQIVPHIAGGKGAVDHTVDDDDWDACGLCLAQDGFPAILGGGSEDDVIHALMDEVADGGDLPLLLLLGVVEDEAEAILGGQGLLHAAGVGVAPVALRTDLRETDDDQIVILFISGVAGGGGAAPKQAEHRQQEGDQTEFHRLSTSFSPRLRVMGSSTDTVEPLPTLLSKERP